MGRYFPPFDGTLCNIYTRQIQIADEPPLEQEVEIIWGD